MAKWQGGKVAECGESEVAEWRGGRVARPGGCAEIAGAALGVSGGGDADGTSGSGAGGRGGGLGSLEALRVGARCVARNMVARTRAVVARRVSLGSLARAAFSERARSFWRAKRRCSVAARVRPMFERFTSETRWRWREGESRRAAISTSAKWGGEDVIEVSGDWADSDGAAVKRERMEKLEAAKWSRKRRSSAGAAGTGWEIGAASPSASGGVVGGVGVSEGCIYPWAKMRLFAPNAERTGGAERG